MNFEWKTDEEEPESIVLLIFVFWWCLNCKWKMVGWGTKFYLGAGGFASFFIRDFSRSNKHDTCWHAVSTGCFYVSFLWTIAVSDFCLLEIYKKFIRNLFQILYSLKSVIFFIKMQVLTLVFYIKIWFKCETPLVFVIIRAMAFFFFFAVDYVKFGELHIVHT